MAIIGLNTTVDMGGVSITSLEPNTLMYGANTYTPLADEEITEVGVYIGSSLGDGAGIEIGVYDVTNGAASATLVVSKILTALVANSFNSSTVLNTPIAANKTYAVAFSILSDSDIVLFRSYASSASDLSTDTGSAGLQATWSSSSVLNQQYAMYALTASVATDTTAPTLSSPTSSAVTNNNATLGATTDESGTAEGLYYLANETTAPTDAEVIDGTYAGASGVYFIDLAVNAGAFTFPQITNLVGNSAYAFKVAVTDASGNISNVLTGTFTTQNATMNITISNVTSVSNVPYDLMDGAFDTSNNVLKSGTFNIDSSGAVIIDLNDVVVADGQVLEGMAINPIVSRPIPIKGTVSVV